MSKATPKPQQPPSADQGFSLVAAELEIAQFWRQEQVFQQSLQQTAKLPPYIFYDGPPFATGLPHHGHFVASTIKDVVPRYWTMQGYHVMRRFGWDCHGLPIEYEIDKKLGMSTQEAIAKLGIAGYNQECRSIVQRYVSEWQVSIERLGRWVDFDNDYKTMDIWFMESVWWVFQQLWQKGLIYKGFKVMPVSTALSTVLSNFEANANYQQVQDPAITIRFKLCDEDASLLAWTTTPWTLPSNLAIAVGADIDYVKVYDTEEHLTLYLAKARLPEYAKSHSLEVLAELPGNALVGHRYEPLFPYFQDKAEAGAFVVFGSDYVTADNGTGLVHMAPAFGDEDYQAMTAAGLDVLVCPVDMAGIFSDEVTDFAGQGVKQADADIIRYLKRSKALYQQDVIEHSYPFCYRSDTPLIYRAIESWYVAVTKIKDQLIAANEKVHWVPEHIKHGRFGNWLKDAKDWAISRNRIWGTPLPVWVNNVTGQTKCFGSIAELAEASGQSIEDLHRESVDPIEFSQPGEQGIYQRIPEVLDCWFESGAMPYAQLHYPFANQDKFEQGFPAAFVSEGLDQTRGWFYTLMVLATALYDKPAFKNVIVSGMVMAEDGKKMSKRLRNYTPPDEIMETYGADPLRLYLISGNLLKGEEQRFSHTGVREMGRRVLLPWYNAFKFLNTYARLDQWSPTQHACDKYQLLDKWLLSRLQTLKVRITKEMSAYRLYNVMPALFDFIEELTNWYIRLNRSRFWSEGLTANKLSAYTALHQTIYELCLIMAPFTPFLAETIYRKLLQLDQQAAKDKPISVHLCRFPKVATDKVDERLESVVRLMQEVILLGRQERERQSVHLRTPVRTLTIIHKDQALLDDVIQLEDILRHELNVKAIHYSTAEDKFVTLYAKPNFPVLGKRLGKRMRSFQQAIEQLSHAQIEQLHLQGHINLAGENFTSTEIQIFREPKAGIDCVTNKVISIVLDCQLDDDLIAEGRARELIRLIQKTRQASGCQVTDRIQLSYSGDQYLLQIMHKHSDYICGETLAIEIKNRKLDDSDKVFDYTIDQYSIQLAVTVA